MAQIITPASGPLLCHCPLAKPKEIPSLLFVSQIWGFHQPVEGEAMASQRPGRHVQQSNELNKRTPMALQQDRQVSADSKLILP